MLLDFSRTEDVQNEPTARLQEVRDEAAVTSPPHCLGTHDGSAFVASQLAKHFDSARELRRFHVVGVSSESFVSPGSVRRVRSGATTAAQFTEMFVSDPLRGERCGELLLSEVGISP